MGVFFMLLFVFVKYNHALERQILLKIEYNDGTLEGLGCAIDDPFFGSGGKFDTLTKTCTRLSKNWFSNPTFEANNNYFRLLVLEHLSPKIELTQANVIVTSSGVNSLTDSQFCKDHFMTVNVSLDEAVPTLSTPGGSVILDIISSGSPTTGSMWTDFKDSDFKTAFLQKLDSNKWCFDAVVGSKDCINNAITQPNRAYQLEYVFTDTHLQVYLDGFLEYSFEHRVAIARYQRFRLVYSSGTGVFICKRIIYSY